MNRSLTVELIADVTRFNAGMGQALSSLTRFGEKAQQIGTALSVGLSAPLALLGKKAIDAFGEMDALTRGLATLEKSAQTLQTRLTTLQEVAKLPGLGYKEAIQFDISLRSAGFSADLSKKSMLAFGNALASIGKGKNELKGVSLQLQQLATKTGGFGADIRIIKEYAPQVGAALQAAFGTSNTEAIAKMGVTGKQVVEKIVAELDKLPKATGGIKNAFENLEDNTFRSLAKLGESLNNALGIEGLVNRLGSAIGGLVNWFTELDPPTQKVFAAFGAALIVIPPLLAGLGLLSSTVLPAVAAGFALITGPIGIAIAVVAAAATLIVMHWDKVKRFLLDSNLWNSVGDVFKDGLGFLTSLFGVFANLFQGDWTNMWEHAKNLFKYAWNAFIGIAGSGILAIGGLFAKMLSFMKLDSWAKGVQQRMNEVFTTMRSRQFIINSPKVQGGLFSGLNFGGAGVKDGSNMVGSGDGKKKKKKTDDETYIESVSRRLSVFEGLIRNYSAEGLAIPEYVMMTYNHLTDTLKNAEEGLKRFQKVEISGAKQLESNNVIKTKYTKYDQKSEPVAFSMAPKLPGVEKFNDIQKAAKRVSRAVVDLNKDIQDNLKQAAESAFVGMGEVIGGLLAGTASLSDLPKLLLGVLGSLLEQLGKMAIAVGLGVQAIQTALKTLNPFVAIAAGVGLIALGALVKSGSAKIAGGGVKAFEKGGLFTGESTIRVAESSKARAGGGEWVSPIGIGADLISARIMDNMSSMIPAINPQSQKPVQQTYQLGTETLIHKISGQDIMLILERTKKSQTAYGNG